MTHGDVQVDIVKPARRRDSQQSGAGGVRVTKAGHPPAGIERDGAGHQVTEVEPVRNDPVEGPIDVSAPRPFDAHPKLGQTCARIRVTLQDERQWSRLGGHAESIRHPTLPAGLRADSVVSSPDVATVEDADTQ